MIGLATEQCPSYKEVPPRSCRDTAGMTSPNASRPRQVRKLGGVGFNGGVQLLDLRRMRESKQCADPATNEATGSLNRSRSYLCTRRYARLLAREAARELPMKPGGIGWLGDQTLYSWMSVNATGELPPLPSGTTYSIRKFISRAGASSLFYHLPCGWNRQTGTHMADWKGFWRAHRRAQRSAESERDRGQACLRGTRPSP